jgi:5'-nucleotidase
MLGNFIADAQLHAGLPVGAQIALANPGELADTVNGSAGDPEDVTYRNAAGVQPQGNTLVAMDLTGEQLRRVLEQQWQQAGDTWPFLKPGASASLFHTYDPGAPFGQHITRM